MRPGSISKCYKGMFSEKKNKIKRVAGEARGKKEQKKKIDFYLIPPTTSMIQKPFHPLSHLRPRSGPFCPFSVRWLLGSEVDKE